MMSDPGIQRKEASFEEHEKHRKLNVGDKVE
jgi:hypothetical protein